MSAPTFEQLDFIADMLYQRHAVEVQKYATGVRWWCHRHDGSNGRDYWRKKALKEFTKWQRDESLLYDSREALPLAAARGQQLSQGDEHV